MRPSFLLITLLASLSGFGQDYSNLNSYINELELLRKSNCDSALQLIKELDLTHAAVTKDILPRIHEQLGLSYYCIGQFDDALLNYQAALDGYDFIGDNKAELTILNLIGTLQNKQGNRDKALAYFKLGLQRAISESDSMSMGNSLNNLGLVYLDSDLDKALDYFVESTEIKEQLSDTIGLSYNYDNLGQTYSLKGEYELAIRFFELAGDYKELGGDQIGYAIVQNNIGEMLLKSNQPNAAENYFKLALDIASEVKYLDFKQHILNMLSQTYEQKGATQLAFEYFKSHVALKDSLYNEQKSKQVAELETKYETEKKERKIEVQQAALDRNQLLLISSGVAFALLLTIGILGRNRLKWKNKKLLEEEKRKTREAEMNAVISSQEKERNRFARDLHDGFGQLISTLNLNLKNLKNPKSPEDKALVFDSSVEVLEEMYQELKNICFDLMPQTLIKHGLDSAIQEYANRINLSKQIHIEVNIYGLEERLSELHEISLYRISQEWVNNVIKYSDADTITIQITKDENEITLLIEDNGMGFDRKILLKGKGNGWKNMTSRSNLIHGELELDTTPNMKGNTLILNAALAKNRARKLELV